MQQVRNVIFVSRLWNDVTYFFSPRLVLSHLLVRPRCCTVVLFRPSPSPSPPRLLVVPLFVGGATTFDEPPRRRSSACSTFVAAARLLSGDDDARLVWFRCAGCCRVACDCVLARLITQLRHRGCCADGLRILYWNKEHQKWHALRSVKDVLQHLGFFDSAADAARAYDKFLLERVPGAPANFPQEGTNDVKATKRQPCTEELEGLEKDARTGRCLMPGGAKEYKCVSWECKTGQWKAECYTDSKRKTRLFPSSDQKAAAEWYDEQARMCGKKYVNFPVSDEMQAVKGVTPLSAASSSTSEQSTGQHNYKGVYRDGRGWRARVYFIGKIIHGGIYPTPLKAARAFDNLKRLLRLRCVGGIPPHLFEMNFHYLPCETQAVPRKQSNYRKRYLGAVSQQRDRLSWKSYRCRRSRPGLSRAKTRPPSC